MIVFGQSWGHLQIPDFKYALHSITFCHSQLMFVIRYPLATAVIKVLNT